MDLDKKLLEINLNIDSDSSSSSKRLNRLSKVFNMDLETIEDSVSNYFESYRDISKRKFSDSPEYLNNRWKGMESLNEEDERFGMQSDGR